MTTDTTKTQVGSYFISNYPPFSQWTEQGLVEIERAMQSPPAQTPLGLYLHIPFCRKRCRFCYFKVYTDKNSADIRRYVEALQKELSLYADKPFAGGRPVDFIYFGGGTPSYLSVKQLQELTDRLKQFRSWDETREVAFECEPGTLSGEKLNVIREIGVTRLSLGVENFND